MLQNWVRCWFLVTCVADVLSSVHALSVVNILHNALTLYKRVVGSKQQCSPSQRWAGETHTHTHTQARQASKHACAHTHQHTHAHKLFFIVRQNTCTKGHEVFVFSFIPASSIVAFISVCYLTQMTAYLWMMVWERKWKVLVMICFKNILEFLWQNKDKHEEFQTAEANCSKFHIYEARPLTTYSVNITWHMQHWIMVITSNNSISVL